MHVFKLRLTRVALKTTDGMLKVAGAMHSRHLLNAHIVEWLVAYSRRIRRGVRQAL